MNQIPTQPNEVKPSLETIVSVFENLKKIGGRGGDGRAKLGKWEHGEGNEHFECWLSPYCILLYIYCAIIVSCIFVCQDGSKTYLWDTESGLQLLFNDIL